MILQLEISSHSDREKIISGLANSSIPVRVIEEDRRIETKYYIEMEVPESCVVECKRARMPFVNEL